MTNKLGVVYVLMRSLALACLVVAFALPVHADRDPMQIYASWARDRPELRDGVPHAVWSIHLDNTWRLQRNCVEGLAARGVRAHRLAWTPTPAPDIVVVEHVTGGVEFVKRRENAPVAMACAMAERLPQWSALLRDHNIAKVEILSAYRREPAVSFHHMGLALDVTRLWDREDNVLDVERDWTASEQSTCRSATTPLERVVCAMHESELFTTVITPNYGRGHEDHLHLDIRPDDPWHYLR